MEYLILLHLREFLTQTVVGIYFLVDTYSFTDVLFRNSESLSQIYLTIDQLFDRMQTVEGNISYVSYINNISGFNQLYSNVSSGEFQIFHNFSQDQLDLKDYEAYMDSLGKVKEVNGWK